MVTGAAWDIRAGNAHVGGESADSGLGALIGRIVRNARQRRPVGYNNFLLDGAGSVWVEAQVFRLFNHVNYDLPERYADGPTTFGRILSARAAWQSQLAVRVSF